MIDRCHAEGIATSKETASPLDLPNGLTQVAMTEGKGLLEALKQGEGRADFTSSRGHQLSWVRSDGLLSLFTHYLLEALQGAGSMPGKAEVCLSRLMGHLSRAVLASARQIPSANQVPFFDKAAGDVPVALLKTDKWLSAGGWNAVKLEAEEVIPQVIIVVASGERAVAIGGSVSGARSSRATSTAQLGTRVRRSRRCIANGAEPPRRVGRIDDVRKSRARCFGVVGRMSLA